MTPFERAVQAVRTLSPYRPLAKCEELVRVVLETYHGPAAFAAMEAFKVSFAHSLPPGGGDSEG